MANFLTTTGPSQVAGQDASADQLASANRRKTAAYNALSATYGPAAGDPDAQAQLIQNDTAQQTQPDKVDVSHNAATASDMALDAAKRADTAWQAKTVAQAAKDSGNPAKFLANVDPSTLTTLGVDPAHVGPLIDHLNQNPGAIDQILTSLAPAAGASKLVAPGTQVQWATDQNGKKHALFPTIGSDGKITYQEPQVPAGTTLDGMTPVQAAAAATKATTAAQTGAAFATDVKAEDVAPMITAAFPGAKITGLGRSSATNKAVGGVPNSMHLSDNAIDFVAPAGTKLQDVVNNLRAQGLPVTEALNEGQVGDQGPHFHIGWAPKPTAAQTNAAIAGNSGGALDNPTMQDLYDRQKASGTAPVFGSGAAGTAMRAQYYKFQATADASQGGPQAAVSAAQAGKAAQAYQVDLTRSTPNSNGGRVNAFNTLLNHADVTQNLAAALQNGNVQVINQAKAAYQQATGNAAPTNLALAANALADETAKAIVGSSAVFDRKEFVKAFSKGNSPDQWAGALGTVKDLAVGQLTSLRQTATSVGPGATTAFDAHLTPKAKTLLGIGAPAAPAAPDATAALRSKYGL